MIDVKHSGWLLLVLLTFPSADFIQAQGSEEEWYDLLMALDMLEQESSPTTDEDDQASASAPNLDEAWVLSMLESLDNEVQFEHEQAVGQLRLALMTLRRQEQTAEGEVRATVEQASGQMLALLEAVETLQPVRPDAFRYTVASGQRALALVHLQQANLPPRGTLADPRPTMQQRLAHLARGANYARQACQTARFRLPEKTQKALATALAMSRLFRPSEVSLGQVRERIRGIEAGLDELGKALPMPPVNASSGLPRE